MPLQLGGYCKHVVADLLQLAQNHLDATRVSSEEREQRVDSALQKEDRGRLKESLQQELEWGPELQHRLLARFGNTEAENSLQDYRNQVRKLYTEVTGTHGLREYDGQVDFSFFYDLARNYCNNGDVGAAAKIYGAVSEVIAAEMDRVDNSTGYYGDEFQWAVSHYAGVLAEAELDFQAKKSGIDYLFEKFLEDDSD